MCNFQGGFTNNLQITPYEFKGNPVRTITGDNETWFVAKDVCDVLGFGNSREALSKHVDDDDVTKRDTVPDSLGRKNTANCVNESGLYALIFGSRLPAAKEFKRWVTKEVLPQIRKSGQYRSDASLVLTERSIARVKELYAKKLDENIELRRRNSELELRLILRTTRRHTVKDIDRMISLSISISEGDIDITEEELARAFRMSPDRYKLVSRLWHDSRPFNSYRHKKRQELSCIDNAISQEV